MKTEKKGNGVRFNSGKAPYEFLPIGMISEWLSSNHSLSKNILTEFNVDSVITELASWQIGKDVSLDKAISYSIPSWDLTGFSGAAHVFKDVTERPINPYPKWNWMLGMKWGIVFACVIRHALKIKSGENIDDESKRPHRDHIICNLLMLLFYSKTYKEGDDRPDRELFHGTE